jgi:hypothetical protein
MAGREETLALRQQRAEREYKRTRNVVMVPPTPLVMVCTTPGPDGVVGQTMTPYAGKAVDVHCVIQSVAKGVNPQITVGIQTPEGISASASFPVKAGLSRLGKEVELPANSMITVSVTDPESVTGIWISILFQATPSDASKKAFLMEELEKSNGEGTES